jgi:hypothetical protein
VEGQDFWFGVFLPIVLTGSLMSGSIAFLCRKIFREHEHFNLRSTQKGLAILVEIGVSSLILTGVYSLHHTDVNIPPPWLTGIHYTILASLAPILIWIIVSLSKNLYKKIMHERDLQGKDILSYFSRSERQRLRIEKYRRTLPSAAVAKIESSSQGEELLRALNCLYKIHRKGIALVRSRTSERLLPLKGKSDRFDTWGPARGWFNVVSIAMVGTRAYPASYLSTKSQLETLIDAILRESAIGIPQIRDMIVVTLARGESGATSRHFRDFLDSLQFEFNPNHESWDNKLSEDDIAKTVGDRLLLLVGIQRRYLWRDRDYLTASNHAQFGIYGRVLH